MLTPWVTESAQEGGLFCMSTCDGVFVKIVANVMNKNLQPDRCVGAAGAMGITP
jgi:hypothetical protein